MMRFEWRARTGIHRYSINGQKPNRAVISVRVALFSRWAAQQNQLLRSKTNYLEYIRAF
jgi:hypothetical protein